MAPDEVVPAGQLHCGLAAHGGNQQTHRLSDTLRSFDAMRVKERGGQLKNSPLATGRPQAQRSARHCGLLMLLLGHAQNGVGASLSPVDSGKQRDPGQLFVETAVVLRVKDQVIPEATNKDGVGYVDMCKAPELRQRPLKRQALDVVKRLPANLDRAPVL